MFFELCFVLIAVYHFFWELLTDFKNTNLKKTLYDKLKKKPIKILLWNKIMLSQYRFF